MQENSSNKAASHITPEHYAGQRLDNYLLREWRGVPRSLIYRLIRTGQVRVNAARVSPDHRLQAGDRLRLPPTVTRPPPKKTLPASPLALPILYEDESLLAIVKPTGLAVHGGSGVAHGVIERLRANQSVNDFLELVHRLDRDTSGVLLLAKKPAALRSVQSQWRARQVQKIYTALLFGHWQQKYQHIDLPLKRIADANGNRRVIVAEDGKAALTRSRLLQQWPKAALVEANIATGRTHQLRVHFAAVSLPIVGDDKYGHFADNRQLSRIGTNRLFLHATQLTFKHPKSGRPISLHAPLPPTFKQMGEQLNETFA